MLENNICPKCHQPTIESYYFCPNCGYNLRPVPLSTSIGTQAILYIKTLLLPPLGIIWGYRYLRQPGTATKLVGLFTIIITIIELYLVTQATVYSVNLVNQQINQQFKMYGL